MIASVASVICFSCALGRYNNSVRRPHNIVPIARCDSATRSVILGIGYRSNQQLEEFIASAPGAMLCAVCLFPTTTDGATVKARRRGTPSLERAGNRVAPAAG